MTLASQAHVIYVTDHLHSVGIVFRQLLDLSFVQGIVAERTTDCVPSFSIDLRLEVLLPAIDADIAAMLFGGLVRKFWESIDWNLVAASNAFLALRLLCLAGEVRLSLLGLNICYFWFFVFEFTFR